MNEDLFGTAPSETVLAADRNIDPKIYLGTCGWSYADWNGVFYPHGTASKDRLHFLATQMRTVEIDSTFYGVPALATVQKWYTETPDDFVFAPKFPKSITHERRLIGCAEETYRFIETMGELAEKLGPMLLQFPPSFRADRFGDLEAYLQGLPDGLMYAVEVRNRSWLTDDFAELLKAWNVSLVMSCGGALDRFWRTTTSVAYIRWLGEHVDIGKYDQTQFDKEEDIDWWIPRIRHFTEQGGTVFGYVNNHYAGHSPATIHLLNRRLREHAGA